MPKPCAVIHCAIDWGICSEVRSQENTVALVMLILSCSTAVVAGRGAVSVDALRAVKEDW